MAWIDEDYYHRMMDDINYDTDFNYDDDYNDEWNDDESDDFIIPDDLEDFHPDAKTSVKSFAELYILVVKLIKIMPFKKRSARFIIESELERVHVGDEKFFGKTCPSS